MSEHKFCFDWDGKSWSEYTKKDWDDFAYWVKHGPRDRVDAYLSGGLETTEITVSYLTPKGEWKQVE